MYELQFGLLKLVNLFIKSDNSHSDEGLFISHEGYIVIYTLSFDLVFYIKIFVK